MPLLGLFPQACALSALARFVGTSVLLALAARGGLAGGAGKMQAGFAVSEVLPHPMEPTLKRLSNQDLIVLTTIALCDLLSKL